MNRFMPMREFILREARKDAIAAAAQPTDPRLLRMLRVLRGLPVRVTLAEAQHDMMVSGTGLVRIP